MGIGIDVDRLVRRLETSVAQWHRAPLDHEDRDPILSQASELHGYNFQLWHQEDEARAKGVGDKVIGQVKRRIDSLNQARNDAIEALDEVILTRLRDTVRTPADAPPHSETVGNIVDRLSILSLKIFHMEEETQREEAGDAHRIRCQAKLAVLQEQRGDLAGALGILLDDLTEGRKRFKVYRQMKMYNDPSLNPVLYGKGS